MSLSATPSASPATLAGAALPSRVRDILDTLKALLWQALDAPLQATMTELERELFDQAERARSSHLQQDIYQELQGLRARRERFAPFYKAQLEATLASLRQPPAPVGPRPQEKAGPAMQMLTLVSDVDIDRDIVLHDIARREVMRAGIPLQLLGQRFGVLAARPAFEPEQTPLGPHPLCRILREAGEELQLGLDAQLTLYRAFERQVLARYGEIVERANVLLTHAGVLPGLVYLPYVARPPAEPASGARGAARAPSAPRPATGWSGQSAPAGGPGPRADAAAGSAAQSAPGGPSAAAPQARVANAAATGATGATAATAGTEPTDLATLRQLLAAARTQVAAAGAMASGATAQAAPAGHAPGAPPPATGARTPTAPGPLAGAAAPDTAATRAATPAVPTAALLQALGELQAQPPAYGAQTGPRGRRQLRDVQAALLAALNAAHGAQPALAPQDADTFELLGLLYAEIEREVRSDAPAAALLERLQVPLVRAALQDPAFFARPRHPARELLNAVAESGATWLSDEDTDPQLLAKLNQTVDRVVEDYEGDEQVFEQAHQDIQAHYRALAHKAEIAERRHIEAARGKERLEMAKQLAATTLETLCHTWQPPKFVQALLKQAWSDVLVLTLLRQGEESDAWRERQQLTQCIAEVTCGDSGGAPDLRLADDVRGALLQVGYHQDEAAAIARRLSTPGGGDTQTSRTELSARLKARTRLGDQGEDERPPLAPRNAAEQAAYARLRSLPFGTWFEFVTNQQGDFKRQRLSWYSPVTDRALFVNQRGHKTAEYSLDALSRLLAQGQARIVTEDRARLIDRAWQATVRALRTLAGAPAPSPAMEDDA